MENFNKNWLAILLIAVVFGALGFLFGRITSHPPRPERMMFFNKNHGMNSSPNDSWTFNVEVEAGELPEGDVIIKLDTPISKNKTVIIRKLK